MNLFDGINFYAVGVAAIVYYITGFIWYTVIFGKIWRIETGIADKEMKKPNAGQLVGQFVSTFLYVLGIAIILRLYGTYGIREGIIMAAILTVFFIIPINTGNLFFTGKKRLFLLDVCERALGTLLTGIILGIWQ